MNTDGAPIRVLVVDDHPAVRSGLKAVLTAQPGFVSIGVASGESELWPLLHSASPDVVVMDYHLPGTDGLTLCRQLKAHILAPRVIVYSAYAGSALAVPAYLAGADGLVSKAMPAADLYAAIARVVDDERVLPPLRQEDVETALADLPYAHHRVIRALLDGAPPAEAARAGEVEVTEVASIVDHALGVLRVEVPTASTVGL